jgi:sugar O-acyltransferase (sialic acid O-acetyltransferase NeuD family)
MRNILLIGGGEHVRYCIDIIEKENKYTVIGITDLKININTAILGYQILGEQKDIDTIVNTYNIDGGIITIGDNWKRKIAYDFIKNKIKDFQFGTAIHPSTIIGKNVEIGRGTVIMAGCIISPNAKIGDFCFLASGAILEHDSIMNNFSSLSAGSVTGGNVKIGEYSAITLGVTIFDRISIGEHTVVGSGSLVTKDIPSHVLAYGAPAKIIRSREIGESYLGIPKKVACGTKINK